LLLGNSIPLALYIVGGSSFFLELLFLEAGVFPPIDGVNLRFDPYF